MNSLIQEPSSYRDPTNKVYLCNDRVLRLFTDDHFQFYKDLLNKEVIKMLMDKNQVIPTSICQTQANCLEHKRIPVISYPHEWCFEQLKDAALHTLAIVKSLASTCLSLKDGNCYNIQWQGTNPVFIDFGSICSLDETLWKGYNEFLTSFYHPLDVATKIAIPTNKLFFAYPFNFQISDFLKLYRIFDKLNFGYFKYIYLNRSNGSSRVRPASIPKNYISKIIDANCSGLQNSIQRKHKKFPQTQWNNYYKIALYNSQELDQKIKFIDIIGDKNYKQVLDIGCNDGTITKTFLKHNCEYIVAIDFDEASINNFYKDIQFKTNLILPLVVDIINPLGPSGWNDGTRFSFLKRIAPDLICAFAVIHHLVFNWDINLKMIADLLNRYQADLILEFVDKEDPVIQQYIQKKGDNHPTYSRNVLVDLLPNHKLVKEERIGSQKRFLMFFKCG